MKKILVLLLTGTMLCSLAACGNQKSTASETAEKTSKSAQNSETIYTEESASESTNEAADEKKSAVVYFSCTGNTKAIAEYIAEGTGAEIYEIVPVKPYTDADLNYNDNDSRSTKEMNDASVRPEIAGDQLDLSKYTTVYIGYPIWWGEAPRIIDTFVENYDFSGKTVIPFCTSASSGMGSSAKTLESLAGTGTWQSGQRFEEDESKDNVIAWVNGL